MWNLGWTGMWRGRGGGGDRCVCVCVYVCVRVCVCGVSKVGLICTGFVRS